MPWFVDSFFSYLSSKLLNENGFIHGSNFYGSFITIQDEFKLNIYDDLEYLYDSSFFHKNIDVFVLKNHEDFHLVKL